MYRFLSIFFFFNDTATTEIYTLSLHDALPICRRHERHVPRQIHHSSLVATRRRASSAGPGCHDHGLASGRTVRTQRDRKSTRLNSSHGYISYAVFCLKKKKSTCPGTSAPPHPS